MSEGWAGAYVNVKDRYRIYGVHQCLLQLGKDNTAVKKEQLNKHQDVKCTYTTMCAARFRVFTRMLLRIAGEKLNETRWEVFLI